MKTDDLVAFIKANPDNFSIQLKRHHRPLFDVIDAAYNFPKFGQKLYHYIHGDNHGKCDVCEKDCKFDGFNRGYRKSCSYKCMNIKKKVPPLQKTCPVCSAEFTTDKRHNRVTCSVSCQNKYIQLPEHTNRVQESLKKTMLKKHGVVHNSQMKDFAQKIKATKLKNHGDENYVNTEKSKQTKQKKYGDEHYNNTVKFKKTCLKKYGVDNPSKVDEITDRATATKISKFGPKKISNTAMTGVKERLKNKEMGYQSAPFKEAILKKYGVENTMQNKEVANRASNTVKDEFYESLVSGDRLGGFVTPMFSRDNYFGTRGKNNEQIFYKFKCVTCDAEFEAVIEDGKVPVCKKCYPAGRSKPETEILEFLTENLPANTEIRCNDRRLIAPMEIDFFIPSKNVAIEFDGVVWHSEFFGGKDRKYHYTKTKMAAEKGVKLIHVFENEWSASPDIVKRKILNLIGVRATVTRISGFTEKTIFARKCTIKEIGTIPCNEFLSQYHIQGTDKSSIKLGAFYKDVLVSVMTFGKGRVALGNKNSKIGEYEMYRFSVGEIPVIGIGGKLLNYFIEKYKPRKITTFADIRYSGLDAFYEKIGFKFCGRTPPNYWYFHITDPYELRHRFGFQKAILHKKLPNFNPDLSEWENMKANGFDRIWDCGNLKYTLFP